MGNGTAGTAVRLLNKKQISAEMGVCGRTIDRWGFSGYIRRIIIGGRIYYSYAEVVRLRDRFIDERPDARLMDSRIRYAGDIHEKYHDRIR
jgi:hypothetical protein